MNARLSLPGLLLIALLPSACHLNNEPGGAYLDIDADSTLLGHDSVAIVLRDDAGADTLFAGKLSRLDTLSRLPAPGYGGGKARIVIQGFRGGRLVYEEWRDYDGATGHAVVDIVFDDTRTGDPPGSLDIKPDVVRLFAGGPPAQLEAAPAGTWAGKALEWTTGDPSVATVSQSGSLSPVGPGTTYVRAAFGDTTGDASAVTVVRDPPVLDAGAADTAVAAGSTIAFRVTVTQEYGDVAAFAWDLDGDGRYEDSAAGAAGQALFAPPPRAYPAAGEFRAAFRARDGEGNVATAAKTIKVGASAPRIDSLAALPAVLSIKDSAVFTARAEGSGSALGAYAWDFDADGKSDLSGSLQGQSASVRGGFRYPQAGAYDASLRVTDAAGATVTATVKVVVKLDRPVVDAGGDLSVLAGAPLHLRGRAVDSMGRIVSREWKVGTAAYAAASDSGTLDIAAPASPGELVCVFRATDDDGLSAEDTLKVAVNDTKAPTVASFAPKDTLVTIKDSVAFAARAASVDADLASYSLDFDGDGKADLQGALSGKSADIKGGKRYPAAGTFNVSLKVADAAGKTATSQARVIVKLDAPRADAGPDTSVAPGGRVNLRGRASDSLGRIARMEWKIGSAAFAAVSAGDTSFTTPTAPGRVECVFRVLDDDSLSAMDTMAVTVTASNVATLSKLVLSAGTLSPAFAAGDTVYTASVASTVSSVTVTPTATNATAAIKVNDSTVASGAASKAIALKAGANVLAIRVTAQNGTTVRTYRVTVTRASGSDARLAGLVRTGGGALTPAFHADTLNYAVTAANNVTAFYLTPTAADTGADITVDDSALASGARSPALALPNGDRLHTVVVRSQDGTASRTYTVLVRKLGPANLVTGYAMITEPTRPRTLGASDWAYNPAGNIVFSRLSAGKYLVYFTGLATTGNAEGIVHATAYGLDSGYCKVDAWTGSDNLSAGVACYNPAGVAMDHSFTVLALFPRSGSGENAYVWADQASATAEYQPYLGRSWNSAGRNTVLRTATGSYRVRFAGMATATDLGNLMVTAHGPNAAKCNVGSWIAEGSDVVAGVNCRNAAGTLADNQFTASLLKTPIGLTFGMAGAHVTGETTDARGPYSPTSANGAISVTSSSTGNYLVTFGGIGEQGAGRTSVVQVTSYGASTTTTCHTSGWANFSDLMVNVVCIDRLGRPVNSPFNVWAIK